MTAGGWKALIAAHKDSILIADTDADVLKIVQSPPGCYRVGACPLCRQLHSPGARGGQSAPGVRLFAALGLNLTTLSQREQVKISSRLLHILRDLLAQRFDRWKFDLLAQPIEKADLNFAFRCQFNGMKI